MLQAVYLEHGCRVCSMLRNIMSRFQPRHSSQQACFVPTPMADPQQAALSIESHLQTVTALTSLCTAFWQAWERRARLSWSSSSAASFRRRSEFSRPSSDPLDSSFSSCQRVQLSGRGQEDPSIARNAQKTVSWPFLF